MGEEKDKDFETAARDRKGGNVISELFAMVAANKKWFLIPIIIALLLVGVLVILGGTAAAPFLYPLF